MHKNLNNIFLELPFPSIHVATGSIFSASFSTWTSGPAGGTSRRSRVWRKDTVTPTVTAAKRYGTDRSCRSDRMNPCLRAGSRRHLDPTVHPVETDPSWLVFASADPPRFTFPRSSGARLLNADDRQLFYDSDPLPSSGETKRFPSDFVAESRGARSGSRSVQVGLRRRRFGPGRGPTVASGPRQRLWYGLLRAAQFGTVARGPRYVDTLSSFFHGDARWIQISRFRDSNRRSSGPIDIEIGSPRGGGSR